MKYPNKCPKCGGTLFEECMERSGEYDIVCFNCGLRNSKAGYDPAQQTNHNQKQRMSKHG